MSEQKIIQGDCLEVMKTFADKSFDLVLTDPPYGIGVVENSGRLKEYGYEPIVGDAEGSETSAFVNEVFRVSRSQIIFGGNYFHLPISRGWIVWDKQGGKKVDYGDCELIWTSFDLVPRIETVIWDGFRKDGERKDKRFHPTQKPTELMRRIIDDFTKESDTILDPFMGSGTTLVAAKYLNRNATGIEISEKYCEIARKRLSQEMLF